MQFTGNQIKAQFILGQTGFAEQVVELLFADDGNIKVVVAFQHPVFDALKFCRSDIELVTRNQVDSNRLAHGKMDGRLRNEFVLNSRR